MHITMKTNNSHRLPSGVTKLKKTSKKKTSPTSLVNITRKNHTKNHKENYKRVK